MDSKIEQPATTDDPLWASLTEVLRRASRVPASSIEPSSHLGNDLGLDSVSLMDAVIELERALAVQIDERGLASVDTVGDLVELVRRSRRAVEA